jgi:hypothetical protein
MARQLASACRLLERRVARQREARGGRHLNLTAVLSQRRWMVDEGRCCSKAWKNTALSFAATGHGSSQDRKKAVYVPKNGLVYKVAAGGRRRLEPVKWAPRQRRRLAPGDAAAAPPPSESPPPRRGCMHLLNKGSCIDGLSYRKSQSDWHKPDCASAVRLPHKPYRLIFL